MVRLDKALVDIGLVSSRERAKSLIVQNAVQVNGTVVNKPGKLVSVSDDLTLLEAELPWVSRGALKLLSAIEHFNIDPHPKVCLDIGASTGGFTEVLLKKGARKVFAVDVGQGQLVEKIKSDERVVNLEKTHVKDLSEQLIPEKASLCVIDVSFISLEKVLPYLPPILDSHAEVVALIKPQFEVGKSNLNNKGIVKDAKLYNVVIDKVKQVAAELKFKVSQVVDSPILGGDGNKEFLIHLQRIA